VENDRHLPYVREGRQWRHEETSPNALHKTRLPSIFYDFLHLHHAQVLMKVLLTGSAVEALVSCTV